LLPGQPGLAGTRTLIYYPRCPHNNNCLMALVARTTRVSWHQNSHILPSLSSQQQLSYSPYVIQSSYSAKCKIACRQMWKEGASIAISHLDVILLSSSVKTSPYATRTRFPSEIFLPLTSDSSNCAERPERLSSLLLNDHLRGDVDFSLAGPLKRPNRGQPLLFMVDI